jgi:hypothetical protein
MDRPEMLIPHIEGAAAVVNLAGENVAAALRWSTQKKARILDSRLAAGRAVTRAVGAASQKPAALIQASAIGYYGSCGDRIIDESHPSGSGFLAGVARQWEDSVADIDTRVRCVLIRTGIVLGAGGFLKRTALPFRFFAGGHPGSGAQWLSWIHLKDEVGAIRFLIEHESCEGPFNLTAPQPLQARDFFRCLGRVMHRPSWAPVPSVVLRLLFGLMAKELILSSQRVMPARLMESGYSFVYPELEPALESIYG